MLAGWLMAYWSETDGVRGADNTSVRLARASLVQPDLYLRIMPEWGGSSRVGEDGYLAGGPEFVAEVAASSALYDLGKKLEAYLAAGVREYLVWNVPRRTVTWFVRKGQRFVKLRADAEGRLHSTVFPGLWLDVAALLERDLRGVLKTLRVGLRSPEHKAFVKDLKARRKSAEG